MKNREHQLLTLGFKINYDQVVYTLRESEETWYIDFQTVLSYTDDKWTKFYEECKR